MKRNASKVVLPPKSHSHGKCQYSVGDRVSVKMDSKTVCAGDVKFVGPSSGRTVVGIRLDQYRSSLGDGKRSNGERHFRCEVGHAIFASPSQCQLLSRKASPPPPPPVEVEAEKGSRPQKGAEQRKLPSTKETNPEVPFDLEVALNEIVGLETVKDMLRSLRNRLVVGRKRAAFGITDDIARKIRRKDSSKMYTQGRSCFFSRCVYDRWK